MAGKKKKNSAAGSGSAAVKAKKGGGRRSSASSKPIGPATLRVFIGTTESVVAILADASTTVGEVRRLAIAAAVAADETSSAERWAGCALRRHDDDALARGATTPSQLEALDDDAATLGALGLGDGAPPRIRLDAARHGSDPPEVLFTSLVDARVAHLLAKHLECAGNVSRRTGDESHLTKAEARAELEALRARLAAADDVPASFREAAAARSDCASFVSGGDLGNRTRGRMSPAFEAAIFALPIGGLSGVVDTEVGLHLILRLPLEATPG